MIKLNFTKNGRDRNWGFFHSLFDFFFPLKNHLRVEALATVCADENGLVSVYREFFTFRNFVRHLYGEPLLRLRKLIERGAESMGFGKELAYKLGAIVLDSSLAKSDTGNTTVGALTVSFTVSGSQRVLVMARNRTDNPASFTTATYAGVNMVKALEVVGAVGEDTDNGVIHTLADPNTGTNTASDGDTASQIQENAYTLFLFTGADTADPFDAVASLTQTVAASITNNAITTENANSFIISCGNRNTIDTSTGGTGQTIVASGIGMRAGRSHTSSYEQKATAGADTQSFSGGTGWRAILSVEIVEFITVATGNFFKFF